MTNYVILFVKVQNNNEPKHINRNQNFKLLMDSVEDYSRKRAKQEEAELDTLSDWVISIRSLIRKRIFKLRRSISFKVRSIFNVKDVVDNLADLHTLSFQLTKPAIISSFCAKLY